MPKQPKQPQHPKRAFSDKAGRFENPKDRIKPRVEYRHDGAVVKTLAKADQVRVFGADGRAIFIGSPDDWDDMREVVS